MDNYGKFDKSIEEAADKFRAIDRNERIRVVSHLDTDGLCACAILLKALNNENRNYSISIVQQLNEKIIDALSKEDYKCYFFTDLGSGQLPLIEKKLSDRKVFILDHHDLENTKHSENIVHINPHLFGIDGGKEISGAGVVYFFTKKLNNKEDMAHIAVIGAIGDIQENNGFSKLNNEILETAIKNNKIEVKRGLRVFGSQTRPLHKVLEYCTDPYIPGVSGSESGAIQLLNQIGINPKYGKDWRKLVHLNKDEIEKLIAALVIRRSNEEKPEDIIGNVYLLKDEKEESSLRDAKEFSTLLNSCGRLNKASIGIGVCLNDENAKRKALSNQKAYKKEIAKAMRWYEENKETEDIIEENGFIIINAKENIMSTIAGTTASIISKSNNIKPGTFILSLARNIMDETTKVSLRISRNKNNVDLRMIIDEISRYIPDSQAGGHKEAAGAIIPTESEKDFIKEAKRIFKSKVIEEVVE